MVRHPSVIVHTFKLEYLWIQLANLDQILCVASLAWEKGCLTFWGRLDQNSGFHGNRTPIDLQWRKQRLHLFSVVFYLILFILAGNEDMHTITDKFEFLPDRPLTTELYALEHSHWLWMGKMVSPSFLSCYEVRLHQTYRKLGQA